MAEEVVESRGLDGDFLMDDDRPNLWWQGPCRCSACGHRWRAVVEIGPDETEPIVPLECPACWGMTGSVDDEPEDA